MEKMMIEEEQGLIPGLPDDVAVDCLSRIPHPFHSQIRPVSRKWRDLVAAPSFLRHRERIGVAEDLIFLVQATESIKELDHGTAGELKEAVTTPKYQPPNYSLAVYNATLATWQRIAALEAVPMFAQISAVEGKLVLIGGWDPVTLDPISDVWILDLNTMAWRRGAPMTSARSFFACAAVGGKVYVAGGHDSQKNALLSAEAYDVASDKWVSLPPMGKERDECRGLCVGGKFWALSGYGTESQGRFATSAEWYDPEQGTWALVEGYWDGDTCASCLGMQDKIFCVDSRGVREFCRESKEWKTVGPGPEGMRSSTCGAVIGRGERIMVTGGEGKNDGWMMDLKSERWIRVERPFGFRGSVYSAAAVRI